MNGSMNAYVKYIDNNSVQFDEEKRQRAVRFVTLSMTGSPKINDDDFTGHAELNGMTAEEFVDWSFGNLMTFQ